MDVRVGLWRRLSTEELMLLNCGVEEDRVPWTARRSNQSILKEISPGCSSEGMVLKLKLQCFGHLMWRVDSLEKTLMLGGIGGRRKRGWQNEMAGWHHRLDGHEFEWTPGVGDGQGGQACCDSWGHKDSDMTEQLNWTEYRARLERKNPHIISCDGSTVLWKNHRNIWKMLTEPIPHGPVRKEGVYHDCPSK